MPKHIGIVAVSPEGSALCYREIHRRACAILGDTGHPAITLHNLPFEQYLSAVMRDDWHTIGALLQQSASVLARAGAEFCITPDNVIQHGVQLAESGSPIPWLTMTDLVAARVASDGRKVVGVVGTKLVMFGSTYQTHLGLKGVKVIAPEAADADTIDGIIFRELVHGEIVEESRSQMLRAIVRLAGRGADAVVIACSEAPLLIGEHNCPLPCYDAVALLADGALRHATSQSLVGKA